MYKQKIGFPAAVLAAVVCLAVNQTASAGIIASDNFQAETVGAAPTNAVFSATAGLVVRDSTTASPFGSGNQWLEMSSAANGAFTFPTVDFSAVGTVTLSFDGYFDNTAFNTPAGRWRARAQDTNGPITLALQDIGYGNQDNSFIPTIGDSQHWDIIYNATAAPVSYTGGGAAGSIAANTLQIWVNGTPVRTNTVTTGSINRLTLWQGGTLGAQSSSWIDNLVLRDEAYVATVVLPATGTNVQWGTAVTGEAGIVTATTNYVSVPTNYVAGTAINPVVGADYYPNATGRTPIFNGAFSVSPGANMQIFDAGSGRDQFQAASGTNDVNTHFTGMLAWESANFLPGFTGSLKAMSTEAYRFPEASATNGTVQFIFQASNGAWYISSNALSLATGFGIKNIANVAAATWLHFTPFTNGVATIGGVAVVSDFSNVKTVGVYFDIAKNAADASVGFSADSFQTTALVGAVTSPTLQISNAVGNVVLNWTGSGFKLQQQTVTLSGGLGSASWTDYALPAGTNPPVNVPVSGAAKFFRLINQ